MSNHIDTRRQSFSRRAILYLLSAISVCSIEIGSARAADLLLQPEPPGQYSDSSEYYEEQLPPTDQYVYRRASSEFSF